MILDRQTQHVECSYEATHTTSEPTFASAYSKRTGLTSVLATSSGNLAGQTGVVVVASPPAGSRFEAVQIAISNVDSVAHDFTFKMFENGILTVLDTVHLSASQQATYVDGVFKISGDAGDAAAVATANAHSDSLASNYDVAGAAATAQAAAEAASDPAGSAATAEAAAKAYSDAKVLPLLNAEATVTGNSTPLVLTDISTFYPWATNWSHDLTPVGATIDPTAGFITTLVAARVFMSACINFTCDQAGGIHIQVFKNGTAVPEHLITVDIVNTGDYLSATISGMEDAAINDVFDIRFESTSNSGSSVIVANANFSMFAIAV